MKKIQVKIDGVWRDAYSDETVGDMSFYIEDIRLLDETECELDNPNCPYRNPDCPQCKLKDKIEKLLIPKDMGEVKINEIIDHINKEL